MWLQEMLNSICGLRLWCTLLFLLGSAAQAHLRKRGGFLSPSLSTSEGCVIPMPLWTTAGHGLSCWSALKCSPPACTPTAASNQSVLRGEEEGFGHNTPPLMTLSLTAFTASPHKDLQVNQAFLKDQRILKGITACEGRTFKLESYD